MSRLEKIINELCPEGVEYKRLGQLGKFYGGLTGKSKEDFKDGNAKFATYMNVYTNPALNLDISDKVKIGSQEKQRTIRYGDVIFTGSSETLEECGFSSVVTSKVEEPLYLNSFCFFLRLDDDGLILPDFAKHLFRSDNLRYQLMKTANGVTRFNVSKKLMERVEIPLPPLAVQREIVRILDKFTEYTAELTAELTARRKQYEYYRDKLLTFGDEVEFKKLGEIATEIYRGSGIKREQITDEGIPCVRYGEIYTTYNVHFTNCVSHTHLEYVPSPKYFDYGNILFAITGESVEDIAKSVAYLGKEKGIAGGDIVVMKHKQNPKYLAYALETTSARIQKSKGRVKSKVVHSNVPAIEQIQIPLPSLSEQCRIAEILDHFYSLCNDLTSGLPAEIAARKKQYEYYRDKLLTFKRKE